MDGNSAVIDFLQQAVSAETQSEAQWTQDAAWLARIGLNGLSVYIKGEAAEEHGHRDRYIARLAQFDTDPIIAPKPTAGYEDVAGLIANQLVLERGAVLLYSQAAKLSFSVGDFVTFSLFSSILADEEKHVEWIEGQQYLIAQLGLQNYLQAYVSLPEA